MDEPTNNLDLDSISILENILKQYKKALVLVSHDKTFIKNININDFVNLFLKSRLDLFLQLLLQDRLLLKR